MPGLGSGTTLDENSSISAVCGSHYGVAHYPVSSVSLAQEGGANEQTQDNGPSTCNCVGSEEDRSSDICHGGGGPQPIISNVVPEVKKLCLNCGTVCVKKKRCKKCKSGCYCSSQCRRAHIDTHAELCSYIQELERIERSKQVFSVRETSQVDVKNRLVSLIGERPTLDCRLNDELTQALWDTGAMVSIVSRD